MRFVLSEAKEQGTFRKFFKLGKFNLYLVCLTLNEIANTCPWLDGQWNLRQSSQRSRLALEEPYLTKTWSWLSQFEERSGLYLLLCCYNNPLVWGSSINNLVSLGFGVNIDISSTRA